MKFNQSPIALGGLANICVGAGIVGSFALTGAVPPAGATVAAFGGNAILGYLGEEHRRSIGYATRKFRKALEKNWRSWANAGGAEAESDAEAAIASFETVMKDITLSPDDLVAAHLNPERVADLVLARAEAINPAAYGTAKSRSREVVLARKFLWDLTHAAYRYLISIQEYVETLQPSLWAGLLEQTDRIEAAVSQSAQAAQVAGMEERLLAAIHARGMPSVSEQALIALARRVAGDVQEPDQALRELEKAVEIALAVQQDETADDPRLTHAVELSAGGDHDAAVDAIEAAITEAEAGHKARVNHLLTAAIEQDRLRRDPVAVAEKLIRQADLNAGGVAEFDDLFKIWMTWFVEGRDQGLLLELSVAEALAQRMKSRAFNPEDRGRAMNLLGIARHTKGERETGMHNLLAAIGAFEEALWEWEPSQHAAHWAKAQMNMANTQHALALRDLGNDRIHRAIASYEAALEAHTKLDDAPMVAMTMMNLGTALRTLAENDASPDAARRALERTQMALDQHESAGNARQSALCRLNLAVSRQVLAVLEADTSALSQAAADFDAVEGALAGDDMAFYRATLLRHAGLARIELGMMSGDATQFTVAREALSNALSGHDQVEAPIDRLTTQGYLAIAQMLLAQDAPAKADSARTARPDLDAVIAALRESGHRRGADNMTRLAERATARAKSSSGENAAGPGKAPAYSDEHNV